MLVKELIEKLKEMPDNAEVMIIPPDPIMEYLQVIDCEAESTGLVTLGTSYQDVEEFCPCCEEMVTLKNPLPKVPQRCPNCNRWILPCSLCNGNCNGCWLKKTKPLNQKEFGEDNEKRT